MSCISKPKCSFIEVLTRLRELSVCRFYIPIRDCKDMVNEDYKGDIFKTRCEKHYEKCYGVYIIWCGHGACDKEDDVLYIGMSGTLDGSQYKNQYIIQRIGNTKEKGLKADEWCEEKLKPNCDKNLYIEVLCLDTTIKPQNIITPECAEALLLRAYIVDYGDLPPANSKYESVKKKCNCS